MDVLFSHQIRKNLEVHVDNMIIKIEERHIHIDDLEDIPKSVRKYDMYLNPSKCSFGVDAGKFMRFMLTRRGIEANPDKCHAVINMMCPNNVKEVQ